RLPGPRSGQSHSNTTVATRTYLRRVLRWWAGKGPAAKPQIVRSSHRSSVQATDRPFKRQMVRPAGARHTCTIAFKQYAPANALHTPAAPVACHRPATQ
ncbi:hypothetical protein EIP99_02590, partial [Xanthomonas campestris pv. raphani]